MDQTGLGKRVYIYPRILEGRDFKDFRIRLIKCGHRILEQTTSSDIRHDVYGCKDTPHPGLGFYHFEPDGLFMLKFREYDIVVNF
ncbi:MAG: hypothetical protein KKD18_04035 [Nanoarchaeota archaeon]|nr:hypothetical protein [Nanoarchaeota archaeon]MBU0977562.1 hypothetical protein [Nanoarchaeota archaeon]